MDRDMGDVCNKYYYYVSNVLDCGLLLTEQIRFIALGAKQRRCVSCVCNVCGNTQEQYLYVIVFLSVSCQQSIKLPQQTPN